MANINGSRLGSSSLDILYTMSRNGDITDIQPHLFELSLAKPMKSITEIKFKYQRCRTQNDSQVDYFSD